MQYRPPKEPKSAAFISLAFFAISMICAITRSELLPLRLLLILLTVLCFCIGYKIAIDFVAEDVLYVLPDADANLPMRCLYVFKASARRSRQVYFLPIRDIEKVVEFESKEELGSFLNEMPKNIKKRNYCANLFPKKRQALITESDSGRELIFIESEKPFLDALNAELAHINQKEDDRHTDLDI